MDILRQEEILSFFVRGEINDSLKLKGMNVTKAEQAELSIADDIICVELSPLQYKINITAQGV